MVNRKTGKFSMEVKKTVDKGVLYRKYFFQLNVIQICVKQTSLKCMVRVKNLHCEMISHIFINHELDINVCICVCILTAPRYRIEHAIDCTFTFVFNPVNFS